MNQTFNQAIWPDEDLEKDLIHYFFFNKSKKEKIEKVSLKESTNSQILEDTLQRVLIWVMEISDSLSCSFQVKQKSIILINQIIARNQILSGELQLLAIICLFISTKIDDKKNLTIDHLIYLGSEQYTYEQFFEMEWRVYKILSFQLSFPVPGEISRFLINQSVMNADSSIFEQIDEFVDFALTVWELAQFPIQIISVSCVLYFLFSTKNEEVLLYLIKFINQNNAINLHILEEFNFLFYSMLSDDQNILNMTKHYFKLCNDPKVSTPQKNRNQIEEEKSTVDTVFINKYSHLASGSPSRNPQSDHDVHINSFTKSAEKDPKFGLEEVVTTIFMMNQMNNN